MITNTYQIYVSAVDREKIRRILAETEADTVKLFKKIKQDHDNHLAVIRARYQNRAVVLNDDVHPPAAQGRIAVINGVTIDKGVPMFCCMVIKSGTLPEERDFLSTQGWTRSYWSAESFSILGAKK